MLKVGLSSYSLSRAINKGEMDIFGAIRFVAERGGKHIEIVPGNSYVVTGNDALAADIVKAVREAGDTVRDEIRTHAPKDTGEYAKSWAVKKRKETSNSLTVVVHSRNRYQLAHLLEFGHAKRGGGRVSAQPHIAAAEAKGMEQLEDEIRKALEG